MRHFAQMWLFTFRPHFEGETQRQGSNKNAGSRFRLDRSRGKPCRGDLPDRPSRKAREQEFARRKNAKAQSTHAASCIAARSAQGPRRLGFAGSSDEKACPLAGKFQVTRRRGAWGLRSSGGSGVAPATSKRSRSAGRSVAAPARQPLRRRRLSQNLDASMIRAASLCDPRQRPRESRATIKGFCAESSCSRNGLQAAALQFLGIYWDKKRVRQACPHASSDAAA